ncbi:hypothetical protein ACIPSE_45045 [Streptomyces sp. NPDC090106]|uniref:hypothetical protein n=1 Tax=Streptomyces sp. NPDC090106 TaxID=3365946 RepID=UPI003829F74D
MDARARWTNPLGLSPREFAQFCAVLHVDTPRKLRAVEVACTVAHRYIAPFVIKNAVDMLINLHAMVAANPRARVIFLGRDGYCLGDVVQQLDPLFHNRYCGELHISRRTADAALAVAEPWADPLADSFRKPGPHREELTSIWTDLVGYADDSNLYLDRDGAEFALVDTGFKGSVQEMLTAAYPNAVFHGHYLFYCAAADDRHTARKHGYALHLDQPNTLDGRALREFVDDPALTFAHHDAIVALEDLLRGSDADIRLVDRQPVRSFLDDSSRAGIDPAKVAHQYRDAYLRQAVLAALARSVGTAVWSLHRARLEHPQTWYAELTQRATVLRPQLHNWLADRPADPALTHILDSFVRRSDKDRWMAP